MSAGGDILWTSLIPGLNNLEKAFPEPDPNAPQHTEGTEQASAPAHTGTPAHHVSGALVVFVALVVLAVASVIESARTVTLPPMSIVAEELASTFCVTSTEDSLLTTSTRPPTPLGTD